MVFPIVTQLVDARFPKEACIEMLAAIAAAY